jgi:hypothetical protein
MNQNAIFDFQEVLSHFDIKGHISQIQPLKSGHIHDTFKVLNAQKGSPDYLLQRMNHHVFRDIPVLMNNIQLVTHHISSKLQAGHSGEPEKEVLTLIPHKNGKSYHQDNQGNFWRMYLFIGNTHSYDIVTNLQQAHEGGRAYGKFLAMLSDLEVDCIKDTIPNFHDIENRYVLLQKAIGLNPLGRLDDVLPEINFVEKKMALMSTINRLGREGVLPSRIVHNDTKFNNVLLNDKNQAQCVVDLDTVMPGYVAYDFGDAIRTIVNTALEDESSLDAVGVNIDLLGGFARGFIGETIGFITDAEIDSLSHGVLLLPFLMGVRFLTDYIDGDNYYKIDFPLHNLQRSRVQFRLVEKLEEKYDVIRDIIQRVAKEQQLAKLSGGR